VPYLIVLYSHRLYLQYHDAGRFAASIGLIIDDAIVVVEQIHRMHEEYPDEHTRHLLKKSIDYLFPAMVGSSISTIVIFIPFLLMTRRCRSLFYGAHQYHDHYAGMLVFCYLDRPAGYLFIANPQAQTRTILLKEKKESSPHVKKQKWVSWFILRPG
jgi:hypothetical protein